MSTLREELMKRLKGDPDGFYKDGMEIVHGYPRRGEINLVNYCGIPISFGKYLTPDHGLTDKVPETNSTIEGEPLVDQNTELSIHEIDGGLEAGTTTNSDASQEFGMSELRIESVSSIALLGDVNEAVEPNTDTENAPAGLVKPVPNDVSVLGQFLTMINNCSPISDVISSESTNMEDGDSEIDTTGKEPDILGFLDLHDKASDNNHECTQVENNETEETCLSEQEEYVATRLSDYVKRGDSNVALGDTAFNVQPIDLTISDVTDDSNSSNVIIFSLDEDSTDVESLNGADKIGTLVNETVDNSKITDHGKPETSNLNDSIEQNINANPIIEIINNTAVINEKENVKQSTINDDPCKVRQVHTIQNISVRKKSNNKTDVKQTLKSHDISSTIPKYETKPQIPEETVTYVKSDTPSSKNNVYDEPSIRNSCVPNILKSVKPNPMYLTNKEKTDKDMKKKNKISLRDKYNGNPKKKENNKEMDKSRHTKPDASQQRVAHNIDTKSVAKESSNISDKDTEASCDSSNKFDGVNRTSLSDSLDKRRKRTEKYVAFCNKKFKTSNKETTETEVTSRKDIKEDKKKSEDALPKMPSVKCNDSAVESVGAHLSGASLSVKKPLFKRKTSIDKVGDISELTLTNEDSNNNVPVKEISTQKEIRNVLMKETIAEKNANLTLSDSCAGVKKSTSGKIAKDRQNDIAKKNVTTAKVKGKHNVEKQISSTKKGKVKAVSPVENATSETDSNVSVKKRDKSKPINYDDDCKISKSQEIKTIVTHYNESKSLGKPSKGDNSVSNSAGMKRHMVHSHCKSQTLCQSIGEEQSEVKDIDSSSADSQLRANSICSAERTEIRSDTIKEPTQKDYLYSPQFSPYFACDICDDLYFTTQERLQLHYKKSHDTVKSPTIDKSTDDTLAEKGSLVECPWAELGKPDNVRNMLSTLIGDNGIQNNTEDLNSNNIINNDNCMKQQSDIDRSEINTAIPKDNRESNTRRLNWNMLVENLPHNRTDKSNKGTSKSAEIESSIMSPSNSETESMLGEITEINSDKPGEIDNANLHEQSDLHTSTGSDEILNAFVIETLKQIKESTTLEEETLTGTQYNGNVHTDSVGEKAHETHDKSKLPIMKRLHELSEEIDSDKDSMRVRADSQSSTGSLHSDSDIDHTETKTECRDYPKTYPEQSGSRYGYDNNQHVSYERYHQKPERTRNNYELHCEFDAYAYSNWHGHNDECYDEWHKRRALQSREHVYNRFLRNSNDSISRHHDNAYTNTSGHEHRRHESGSSIGSYRSYEDTIRDNKYETHEHVPRGNRFDLRSFDGRHTLKRQRSVSSDGSIDGDSRVKRHHVKRNERKRNSKDRSNSRERRYSPGTCPRDKGKRKHSPEHKRHEKRRRSRSKHSRSNSRERNSRSKDRHRPGYESHKREYYSKIYKSKDTSSSRKFSFTKHEKSYVYRYSRNFRAGSRRPEHPKSSTSPNAEKSKSENKTSKRYADKKTKEKKQVCHVSSTENIEKNESRISLRDREDSKKARPRTRTCPENITIQTEFIEESESKQASGDSLVGKHNDKNQKETHPKTKNRENDNKNVKGESQAYLKDKKDREQDVTEFKTESQSCISINVRQDDLEEKRDASENNTFSNDIDLENNRNNCDTGSQTSSKTSPVQEDFGNESFVSGVVTEKQSNDFSSIDNMHKKTTSKICSKDNVRENHRTETDIYGRSVNVVIQDKKPTTGISVLKENDKLLNDQDGEISNNNVETGNRTCSNDSTIHAELTDKNDFSEDTNKDKQLSKLTYLTIDNQNTKNCTEDKNPKHGNDVETGNKTKDEAIKNDEDKRGASKKVNGNKQPIGVSTADNIDKNTNDTPLNDTNEESEIPKVNSDNNHPLSMDIDEDSDGSIKVLCQKCGTEFDSEKELQIHMFKAHLGSFKCKICCFGFATPSAHYEHTTKYHDTKNRPRRRPVDSASPSQHAKHRSNEHERNAKPRRRSGTNDPSKDNKATDTAKADKTDEKTTEIPRKRPAADKDPSKASKTSDTDKADKTEEKATEIPTKKPVDTNSSKDNKTSHTDKADKTEEMTTEMSEIRGKRKEKIVKKYQKEEGEIIDYFTFCWHCKIECGTRDGLAGHLLHRHGKHIGVSGNYRRPRPPPPRTKPPPPRLKPPPPRMKPPPPRTKPPPPYTRRSQGYDHSLTCKACHLRLNNKDLLFQHLEKAGHYVPTNPPRRDLDLKGLNHL